ncbi:MAG: Uma2 family endonuclease [Leptolyngbya sp. SIOISBB]|nr:Uma2 family endonuclease [Leptolyngbya sp. SIOISBB]
MALLNLVKIPIKTIDLAPGSRLQVQDVTWQQYVSLLNDLGPDRRTPQLHYCHQTLEIMAPLPEHERSIVVIADLVKVILRLQQRPWESLRSSTFRREGMAGVEPDDCFYIQNQQAVIGKERLDLTVDPPPDLAIESDMTSKTQIAAYEVIGVPELWVYDSGNLRIFHLTTGQYAEADTSQTFPNLPLKQMIPQVLRQAKTIGTSQALMAFEDELKALLAT